MDLSAFYSQFRDETVENVRILSDGLLALERMTNRADPDYRAFIDTIFRAVHTIKGSARLLGFEAIGRLSHAMEHTLSNVRDGLRALDPLLASALLRGTDALLELTYAATDNLPTAVNVDSLLTHLQEAEAGIASAMLLNRESDTLPSSHAQEENMATPAESSSESWSTSLGTKNRAAPSRQTIRVRVDRLDRLINLTGELALAHQTQAMNVQLLNDIYARMSQQERLLADLSIDIERAQHKTLGRERIEKRIEQAWSETHQLRQLVRARVEQMSAQNDQHGLLLDDLEREVIAVRLLPVSTVFSTLPRAVRELTASLGKEVSVVLSGETTELDRKLLEAINDPLIHLVRNALDHGIEMPDEREAAGKTRKGTLTVSASAVGGEVQITVSDDGRGIDSIAVRASAVRKGLISQQAAEMLSDHETLELLFTPGFSTAQMITDISGRGVGLDVVRTNIVELGGQTFIESQPGVGTTITLLLPLTLVTTRVLLIELAGVTYGLPATSCRSVLWTYPNMIQSIEGQACITFQERTVPLLRLADLLGVAGLLAPTSSERMPTVLIGTYQRTIGCIVDALVDEREAVVKPLGPIFEQRRRYGGAVQLGDGRLVLLLNPVVLAQEARGMAVSPRVVSEPLARARLLVADDSFTTRELIRSILQSAGYDVTVAVDGADALDKLRDQRYDLVVSDVEMPRMNGFQLTQNIRRDPDLLEVPVVLVTSLASEQHKRQGLEAGAQAYVVKSQFNQDNLLGTIRQLLGR